MVSKAKLRKMLKKKPEEKVIKYDLTPLQNKKKCAEFSKAVGDAVENGDGNAEGLDALNEKLKVAYHKALRDQLPRAERNVTSKLPWEDEKVENLVI